MADRPVRVPGPDHPITVEHFDGHVVVTVAGLTVADSHAALQLKEASYPAVNYIPRQDVDMTLLERSAHTSYCPYKGEASYYSLPVGGARSKDAIWSYEQPYDAVASIKDHIAFYADRVDSIKTTARSS